MNFKARKPRASRNRCHMCKPHKELGKNRKTRRRISERKRLAKTEEEK